MVWTLYNPAWDASNRNQTWLPLHGILVDRNTHNGNTIGLNIYVILLQVQAQTGGI